MEITKEVNDELMAACAAWLEMAIRELRNSAQKNKLNLTGEAINSIQGAVSGFGGDGVGEVLISFANYARIRDSKDPYTFQRRPPVDEIEKWILRIGLQKFRTVPGYTGDKRPTSESVAARRIAWGIATRMYQNGPPRRRRWFAKTMYGPLLARFIQVQVKILGDSHVRIYNELNTTV